MLLNRRNIFICLLLTFVSIIMIIISTILSENSVIWTVILNIFISLLGGFILTLFTSFTAFFTIRREYFIEYYGEMMNLKNIFASYINCFKFNFNDIKYTKTVNFKSDKFNTEIVKKFIDNFNCFVNYDYNKIWHIHDDYCSLFKSRKKDKIFIEMNSMLLFFNKYNIIYNTRFSQEKALYEQGVHDEYLYYQNVILPLSNNILGLDDEMKNIVNMINSFMLHSRLRKLNLK